MQNPLMSQSSDYTTVPQTLLNSLMDGLAKHTATSLLMSYAMSASQHVMCNACAINQQAIQSGAKVLHVFGMVLGKQVPNAAMCHYPAKQGGVNIAVAEDRCRVASWSAGLASHPSVMRVMGLAAIQELVGKCPFIGDQLSTVQTAVAHSTGLATLGLLPLAISLKNRVDQKMLATNMNSVPCQAILDSNDPPQRVRLISADVPYCSVDDGSNEGDILHDYPCQIGHSHISQDWLAVGWS